MKSDKHSTDDFAHGAFRPHGRLDMRIEGAIVYADAYGPFNAEIIKAMMRTMRDLRASASLPRPYADIVQFHGSLMGSREMLDHLSAALTQVEGREIASALAFVVARDVEGRDFMLPLFEKVFVQNGRNCRSFDNLAEAEEWVRASLNAAS